VSDGIEHLDFNLDRVTRVSLAATDVLEQVDETAEGVALVVTNEDGGVRVFWYGDVREALENLMRGQAAVVHGIVGE